MSLQIIILMLECVHLVLGVFGIPIYRISRGGSVFVSTLLCWGLWIVWAFTWCVILPAAVCLWSREVIRYFPEAIGLPPLILLAWVPSLLICSIARAIISVIKRRSKSGAAGQTPQQIP